MSDVIELNIPKKCIINIRPTKFIFEEDKTMAKGFVAYDPEGCRAFHYPIRSDPIASPISFLSECILQGRNDFRVMMRAAYFRKLSVMIGQKEVLWHEYEHLFSRQPFYLGKPHETPVFEIGQGS